MFEPGSFFNLQIPLKLSIVYVSHDSIWLGDFIFPNCKKNESHWQKKSHLFILFEVKHVCFLNLCLVLIFSWCEKIIDLTLTLIPDSFKFFDSDKMNIWCFTHQCILFQLVAYLKFLFWGIFLVTILSLNFLSRFNFFCCYF